MFVKINYLFGFLGIRFFNILQMQIPGDIDEMFINTFIFCKKNLNASKSTLIFCIIFIHLIIFICYVFMYRV